MIDDTRSEGQLAARAFAVKLLQFLGIETDGVVKFSLTIGVNEAPTIEISKYIHGTVFGMGSKYKKEDIPLAGRIDPNKVKNFERFMLSDAMDGRAET